MNENHEIEGEFAVGIRKFKNGEIVINSKNNNIPTELILMQLKASVRNLELKYYQEFDRKLKK